jgi:hypothetical protein
MEQRSEIRARLWLPASLLYPSCTAKGRPVPDTVSQGAAVSTGVETGKGEVGKRPKAGC